MSLKQSENYLTYKNGGHRLYSAMTIRRMFQRGELDGKQLGKGKKVFIFKSEQFWNTVQRNHGNVIFHISLDSFNCRKAILC